MDRNNSSLRKLAVQSQKYMEMGDQQSTIDKKMHYYKMALSIYPQNIIVLNKVALTLFNQQKYKEALKYFDLTIEHAHKRNLGTVYFNKSLTLKALKKYEAAYNFIKKAHQSGFSHPNLNEIQMELKEILDEKKRFEMERQKQAYYSNAISKKQYSRWDPPSITVLVNMEINRNWNNYKHRNNLNISDAYKEKIMQKLENKEYCCNTCKFYKNRLCLRKNKIFAEKDSICKHFQPKD